MHRNEDVRLGEHLRVLQGAVPQTVGDAVGTNAVRRHPLIATRDELLYVEDLPTIRSIREEDSHSGPSL